MVRLAIVGIGSIANDYIGLLSEGQVHGAVLTALCSRTLSHMETVCARYGISPALYQNYDELLTSGVADAVIICTPHGQHPSMAHQAIEAGIHVLVEKPVGIFADEVEKLLLLLDSRPSLVCGVMYNRRASALFCYIKSLIESSAIGELVRCTWTITDLYRTNAYYASGAWRGTWQTEGGGILMTQASHQLDLMQWICGMPVSILARCSTKGRKIVVENDAELLFTYANGAHGQFIASAHECPGTNYLEICGTRGRVVVRDDREVECIYLEEDERLFAKHAQNPFDKVPYQQEKMIFDAEDNKVQQAATIQNFVETIQGKCEVQCSLEEGLKSLQIIHGAYISHWEGREVTLPVGEAAFRAALGQFK